MDTQHSVNRLTQTPHFVKPTTKELLDAAIDEAHAAMNAYKDLPYGMERRGHFLAFLRGVEQIDALCKQYLDEYPVAHSNRVRQTGRRSTNG